MIVYNTTVKIDPSIETEWVLWQKEEHIPGIMLLGLFNEYKFYRLLEQDDSDGITYIIQYFASDGRSSTDLNVKVIILSIKNQT